MTVSDNRQRDWNCPNCGRMFRIPAWAEGPKSCPLCATAGADGSPSLARKAWNLATALAEFAVDGFQTVDAIQYEARLTACDGCDRRLEGVCQACGCRIQIKARGRVWQCPLGRWPEQTQSK